MHIGKALSHLTGGYNTSGAETTVQMHLSGQGMPVPDLDLGAKDQRPMQFAAASSD